MARPSDLVKEMELPSGEREMLGRKLDWIEGVLTSVAISVRDAVETLGIVTNLPTGGIFIGIFNSSCPSSWTRVSALDNRFLRGASTYGGTGGGSSHSHSGVNSHGHGASSSQGNHDHTFTTYGQDEFNAGGASARQAASSANTTTDGAHTHSTESAGAGVSTATHLPAFLDVVLCLKD